MRVASTANASEIDGLGTTSGKGSYLKQNHNISATPSSAKRNMLQSSSFAYNDAEILETEPAANDYDEHMQTNLLRIDDVDENAEEDFEVNNVYGIEKNKNTRSSIQLRV